MSNIKPGVYYHPETLEMIEVGEHDITVLSWFEYSCKISIWTIRRHFKFLGEV